MVSPGSTIWSIRRASASLSDSARQSPIARDAGHVSATLMA